MSLKLRVYGILEPGDDDSKYFDPFIIGLISLLFGGIGFRSSLDPFKYIHIAFVHKSIHLSIGSGYPIGIVTLSRHMLPMKSSLLQISQKCLVLILLSPLL